MHIKKIASIALILFNAQLTPAVGGQDPVVAELNGTPLVASKALSKIEKDLIEKEELLYKEKESTLIDYLKDQVVSEEARKQNTSKENLLSKHDGKDSEKSVTDDEISTFLKEKGLSPSDKRINKDDIRTYLKERKTFGTQAQYKDKLFSMAKIKIFLEKPPVFPSLATYRDPINKGPDSTVAELNGKAVKASEVFAQKRRLYDLEDLIYSLKKDAIVAHASQQMRIEYADLVNKISGQYYSELEKKYGKNYFSEVSDKDVTSYLASKGLLADKRINKNDLREYLKVQRGKTAEEAINSKALEAAKFKLLIVDPKTTRPKG